MKPGESKNYNPLARKFSYWEFRFASIPEHCNVWVNIRTEGCVTWGSPGVCPGFNIYSVIQTMHIKFADGKNLEGNESMAKDKMILTKMEIRSGGGEMHPNRDKLKILWKQMNHTNTEQETEIRSVEKVLKWYQRGAKHKSTSSYGRFL